MIGRTDRIEWRIQEVMEALDRRPRKGKVGQIVDKLRRATAGGE